MSPMRYSLIRGFVALALPAALSSAAIVVGAQVGAQAQTQALSGGAAGSQQAAGPAAPVAALYAALSTLEREGSASFAQRAQTLAPLIDRAFNIPTVLQTSVGLRYRSIPEAQKQQLVQVFRQFTVARYVSNFAPNTGDTLKVLPDARPSPYGSDQIVQTELISSSGGATRVDYVMRRFPQGWQAVDVLLDGHISQVAVQRSDFGSTVSTGDANPLIESLKKKIQSFSET